MHSIFSAPLVLLAVAASQVSALALPSIQTKRSAYPFNELVAFGDELSDNGNGSSAHGIAGGSQKVYGWNTWTDGPVAVQYLAGLLDVPLTDYAFGGCCGGAQFGATINNDYTPAMAHWDGKPVPSVHEQIRNNYTYPRTPSSIKTSLQFMWVGQNDLSIHTDLWWTEDPKNPYFAPNISERIVNNAEYLIEQGAPAVFVVNIYPKQLAPVTKTYLCPTWDCPPVWGKMIQTANTAIENAVSKSKHADKLIYYDVYSFMVDLMDNKDKYGITASLSDYCDGIPGVSKWDECVAGSYPWEGAKKFFWMTFGNPTTTVHELIAQDMKKAVDAHFLGKET